jgi:chromosome segregation ATPase
MNEDLEALHRLLNEKVRDLARAQEQATSLEQIIALHREINEFGNRATLVGQLLFRAKTARITAAVEKVQEGVGALNDAIADISRLNAFLRGASKFLGLVDKAIDVAKLVF